MSTGGRILRNLVSLSVAEVINKAISFLVIAYLARTLGAEGFGKLSFAQAVISYFLLAVNLGLDTFGIREIARDATHIKKYVGNIIGIRLVASMISLLLLVIFVYLLDKDSETKQLLLYLGLSIITFAFTIEWLFQGIEQMHIIAATRIVQHILYAGLVVLFVNAPYHVVRVALMQFAAGILAAALLVAVFVRRYGLVMPQIDLCAWRIILRQSLPIGFSSLMITIYYNFDTIMLGFLQSDQVVGWYNGAYRIILLILMAQGLVNASIYPHLSSLYQHNKQKLTLLVNLAMRLMFIFSLLILIVGLPLSDRLILAVYGNDFKQSVFTFQILLFVPFIIFNETITAPLLLASGKQKEHAYSVALGGLINVISNFVLIPRYSMTGAAVATILAEIAVFSSLLFFSHREVRIEYGKIYSKPLIAGCIVLILLVNFAIKSSLGSGLGALTGISMFGLLLYSSKVFSKDEIRLITAHVSRGLRA